MTNVITQLTEDRQALSIDITVDDFEWPWEVNQTFYGSDITNIYFVINCS